MSKPKGSAVAQSAASTTESAVTEKEPAVTEKEYWELAYFKRRESELSTQGYALHEYIQTGKKQIAEAEEQLNNAAKQLEETRVEISKMQSGFMQRFKEIVTSYGIEDETKVTIVDTTPHTILSTSSLPPPVPTTN